MATTGKQLFTTLAPDGKLTVEVAESEFPDPTGNQVLIRMEAAPINPSDLALLLGQAELIREAPARARPLLERARPAFHAEYPVSHPERAVFDMHLAWLALAEGDAQGAARMLQGIAPVLAAHAATLPTDVLTTHTLAAQAHALRNDCAAAHGALTQARSQLRALRPILPRERERLRAAQASVAVAAASKDLGHDADTAGLIKRSLKELAR